MPPGAGWSVSYRGVLSNARSMSWQGIPMVFRTPTVADLGGRVILSLSLAMQRRGDQGLEEVGSEGMEKVGVVSATQRITSLNM